MRALAGASLIAARAAFIFSAHSRRHRRLGGEAAIGAVATSTEDPMFDHLQRAARRAGSPLSRLAGVMLVALALAAAPGAASAQIEPMRQHSSSVGITEGQLVRLDVYFRTAVGQSDLPPGPCRVTLQLVDERGGVVAESVVSLAAGRVAQLDYRPTLRPGQRATVRAVLHGERDAAGLAPQLIPSLEVIDVASGRTTVASPGTLRAVSPQPSPPEDLGLFGLASLQVGHVTASYVGLPTDRGLPPGPCNVTILIVSGDGGLLARREATVEPGATLSLDLAAGELPAGVRRRMYARILTDGRDQGFVTGAVEVLDQATAKSAVLFPADFVQSWGWE